MLLSISYIISKRRSLLLKSKIILGVKSTVLYQLGSLGMIIHPIDKNHNTDVMSGNLNRLAINLYPSQVEFNDFISFKALDIEFFKFFVTENFILFLNCFLKKLIFFPII